MGYTTGTQGSNAHPQMLTRVRAHVNTCARTRMHTHTHAHARTHTHTHTRTRAHTRTRIHAHLLGGAYGDSKHTYCEKNAQMHIKSHKPSANIDNPIITILLLSILLYYI